MPCSANDRDDFSKLKSTEVHGEKCNKYTNGSKVAMKKDKSNLSNVNGTEALTKNSGNFSNQTNNSNEKDHSDFSHLKRKLRRHTSEVHNGEKEINSSQDTLSTTNVLERLYLHEIFTRYYKPAALELGAGN